MAPRTVGSPLEGHLSVKCRKPQMGCRQSSICLMLGWGPLHVSTSFSYPFRNENNRYSAPCIPSCNDFDTQNINECVKIGENRRLCCAIMRLGYVEMRELFFCVCFSADTWLHLNIGRREYLCSTCMGAHWERLNA